MDRDRLGGTDDTCPQGSLSPLEHKLEVPVGLLKRSLWFTMLSGLNAVHFLGVFIGLFFKMESIPM
jgi:hypothetical protein